jgi:hypothetical protein
MANGHVSPVEEIWCTSLPVRAGVVGDAVFAEDGEHLFYAVRLGPQPVYRGRVRDMCRATVTSPARLRCWAALMPWGIRSEAGTGVVAGS